jgi:ABC-type Na+ efflux pump permease subunit
MLKMTSSEEEESQGVVELADTTESSSSSSTDDTKKVVAPFLSQGEISEEAMEMDWNDPKQTRVMFYIILSLIPVLFLIPLMLGSRDLIPIDMLPPVEMTN